MMGLAPAEAGGITALASSYEEKPLGVRADAG